MTFTLWRGSRLLGELRPLPSDEPDPGEQPSLLALLVTAPDAPAFDGVWQVQFGNPAIRVRQFPSVEPDAEAERDQRSAGRQSHSRRVAGRRLSLEEANGVPPELQFTVRDAAGKVHLPQQLMIAKNRFVPERVVSAVLGATAASLVDGVVWTVAVFLEPDGPALNTE
jgi:hypothetical protein